MIDGPAQKAAGEPNDREKEHWPSECANQHTISFTPQNGPQLQRSDAAKKAAEDCCQDTLCKNTGDERDSRKMAGRKMKTGRGFSAIFLPAIFLLAELGLAGEPGFDNVS
jgi:hypothetical protein